MKTLLSYAALLFGVLEVYFLAGPLEKRQHSKAK